MHHMPSNSAAAPSLQQLVSLNAANLSWENCKSILVVRTDHMGDLIMSTPAIACLKNYTNASITLLTSPVAAPCTRLIKEIDDYLIGDLPWMNPLTSWKKKDIDQLVRQIEKRKFDACVIFTVYSQSALPAAMLAWEAGIPRRLAYARENPYQLLTHWVPDREPYRQILHQVQRDLRLVATIIKDYKTNKYDRKITLHVPAQAKASITDKLLAQLPGRPSDKSLPEYLIFHTGASELRRNYPLNRWIDLGKAVIANFKLPILLTGTQKDYKNNQIIKKQLGTIAWNLAGALSLEEFAAIILKAKLLISVNTGSVHIASGLNTPVITLYARTNPQHLPWKTKGAVFEYDIAEAIKSNNEVVRYVDKICYRDKKQLPSTTEIIDAATEFLGAPVISDITKPGVNISN